MYNCAYPMLAGGITVGGVALATNGGSGTGVVGLLAVVISVLLGYRAQRVRRATRSEPG